MQQGYLVYEKLGVSGDLYVAELTQRGIDIVVAGKAVPGVVGKFDLFNRWDRSGSEIIRAVG